MNLVTASGRLFDVASPQPHMVAVEDIAHALAGINRFGGRGRYPYSVALHSVAVADYLGECGQSQEMQLAGLLHDAHKAYIGEHNGPVKVLLHMREFEMRIQQVVAAALEVPFELLTSTVVRHASLVARIVEAEALMLATWHRPDELASVTFAMKERITKPVLVSAECAEEMFLRRYQELRCNTDWERADARLSH